MRIRFIQQFATARQTFRKGNEYDVPDMQASRLMTGGVAVRCDPAPEDEALSVFRPEFATPPAVPAEPIVAPLSATARRPAAKQPKSDTRKVVTDRPAEGAGR